MAKASSLKTFRKVFKRPKNPFEKKRLIKELNTIGKYGLKNKKELWRTQLIIAKLRYIAGKILRKETRNINVSHHKYSLLWFCFKFNLMKETDSGVEFALTINIDSLLERRLQTLIYTKNISNSIHESRILIQHKHISLNGKIINKPSFLVKRENDNIINISINSIYIQKNFPIKKKDVKR